MGDHAMHRRSFAPLCLAGLVLLAVGCVSTPITDRPEQTPAEAGKNKEFSKATKGRMV